MSISLPKLNLPECHLQIREGDNHLEVLDVARHRYVALTPEEWVRQHVLHALSGVGYSLELMQVEGTISLNGLVKRCDIVVYGQDSNPKMIVECKKPQVALTQKVVDQTCRYNTVLRVPYLYLTNGMQHLILKVDAVGHTLIQLPGFPSWDELSK